MLHFNLNPIGTYLKRNTLGDLNALKSGDIYFAENVVETISFNMLPNAPDITITYAFYQADKSTKSLLYWCEPLNLWIASTTNVQTAFWYTTYNVITHQESVCKYNKDDDDCYGGFEFDSPSAFDTQYSTETIKQRLLKCGNKDLVDAVLENLDSHKDWSGHISVDTFERVLRQILSPETAERFIKQMKE